MTLEIRNWKFEMRNLLYLFPFMGALIARAEISPAPSSAPLVWDALEKHADLPAMTNNAYFTFWVTNTSATEAAIVATETSCDCTVVEAAKILPWHIAPGESGPLNVRLNIRGKWGVVTKTITVHSSDGTQELTIHAKIPLTPAPSNISVRRRDMMAAQEDRQTVFRGSCAACHALPADGRTGEPLFVKACGICHTAEHRAEMVPDLAALKHDTDAAYWQNWITHGKEGSLMPAFAQSERGILDPNQIASLVEYLVKTYPSKNTDTNQTQADVPPSKQAAKAKMPDAVLP
jgi:mono/diheme cytochrome c family protein